MRKESLKRVGAVWVAWTVLTFVVLVSSYDSYRCVTDRDILYGVEFNPLCRGLISFGGVALLALYVLLLIYGIAISFRSRSHFGCLLAMGVTIMVFLYVFINIAINS